MGEFCLASHLMQLLLALLAQPADLEFDLPELIFQPMLDQCGLLQHPVLDALQLSDELIIQ